MFLSLFGVTVVTPQFTILRAMVKYLAYDKSKNEVEVTYCMLLSFILNSRPPIYEARKKPKLAV